MKQMNIFGRKIRIKFPQLNLKLIKKKLQLLKLPNLDRPLKYTALILLTVLCLNYLTDIRKQYAIAKVSANTVYLRSPEGAEHQGSATGFEIIAPSGKVYTMTNAHVCELQKDGFIMIGEKRNSNRLIPKRVIEIYPDNDLCLIEGLTGYEGLSLASSAHTGDYDYTIGYPLGESLNIASGYLKTRGKVSILLPEIDAKACDKPHMEMLKLNTIIGVWNVCSIMRHAIQTNIPTFPGNSGSPMFDLSGNVAGVIFASNVETAWGSAVPLEDVIEFLKAY